MHRAARRARHATARHGHWGRALVLLLLFALAAALLSFDAVHAPLKRAFEAAAPAIAAHPLQGALLFVLLSALSAMLAFFSSALLIPVAVLSFGKPLTALLLWLGWLAGGAMAYALGRFVGRPLVRSFATMGAIDHWREQLPPRAGFAISLLVQLALPSEIPGYLFGTMRMAFAAYFGALALVQAPYAVALVWVGDSVLRQDPVALVVLGATLALVSGLSLWLLGRRLRAQQGHRG